MNKNKSLKKFINELISIWMQWLELNKITTNNNESFKNRKKASIKQEKLINKRYNIIKKIDDIFETYLN